MTFRTRTQTDNEQNKIIYDRMNCNTKNKTLSTIKVNLIHVQIVHEYIHSTYIYIDRKI